MPLFLSTYFNKVDKKGRLSVPATFRAAIDTNAFNGIVLFPSSKYNALEGFSYGQMAALSERLDHFDMFSDDQDDLAASIFSSAVPLNFDDNGRIMLPKALAEHAGITDQAAFVGLGPKFQIWQPDALEERQNHARDNVTKKKLTVPRVIKDGGA